MKLVTSAEMRLLEQRAAQAGTSPDTLMENAGLAVAREVRKLREDIAGCHILVLAGPGNNGGDGLVTARHLHDWGGRVSLYICSRNIQGDKNFQQVEARRVPFVICDADPDLSALSRILTSAEIVVDALFGTGKLRPLTGSIKNVLDMVSARKNKRPQLTIVALDLPSGLDADTGAADNACPRADITVTLGYPKVGLFNFPGAERVGRLVMVDIGIPSGLAEDIPAEIITPDWVRSALPRRPLNAHKGAFGKVLVVAGSINYIGAAYLAGAAATRVGAGLVTMATAQGIQPILASKLAEVTYIPLPEVETGVIGADAAELLSQAAKGYEVALLGCGLGQHPSTIEFVQRYLFALPATANLVLDADALNALAKTHRWWDKLSQPVVVTPHPVEMARLTGLSAGDIQSARLNVAGKSAADWGKIVVLKGAYTVIASPDGRVKVNPATNPGLASAGTGDVLAGAVAGLLAQGLSPFDAACCGVYLHTFAGDLVRQELGDAGMVASDLLPKLPLAIKKLKESL